MDDSTSNLDGKPRHHPRWREVSVIIKRIVVIIYGNDRGAVLVLSDLNGRGAVLVLLDLNDRDVIVVIDDDTCVVMIRYFMDDRNRDGKLMIRRVGHARRRCRAGLTCRLQADKKFLNIM